MLPSVFIRLQSTEYRSTYCDRSSINVCRLLLRTQDRFRSAHRLHGGPTLSSIIHLICTTSISSLIIEQQQATLGLLTFCLRHAAQAFTLREIDGAVASCPVSECRGRGAAGDNEGPLSVTCDQVRFGGISTIYDTKGASAIFPSRQDLLTQPWMVHDGSGAWTSVEIVPSESQSPRLARVRTSKLRLIGFWSVACRSQPGKYCSCRRNCKLATLLQIICLSHAGRAGVFMREARDRTPPGPPPTRMLRGLR